MGTSGMGTLRCMAGRRTRTTRPQANPLTLGLARELKRNKEREPTRPINKATPKTLKYNISNVPNMHVHISMGAFIFIIIKVAIYSCLYVSLERCICKTGNHTSTWYASVHIYIYIYIYIWRWFLFSIPKRIRDFCQLYYILLKYQRSKLNIPPRQRPNLEFC